MKRSVRSWTGLRAIAVLFWCAAFSAQLFWVEAALSLPEHQLGARRVAVTTRIDDFSSQAYTPPDLSKISYAELGGGYLQVSASAGAIPGAFPVSVACLNTAHGVTATAASDGSFTTSLICTPGSWVLTKYDPTGGTLISVSDEDPARTSDNSAPGALALVPYEDPSGSGTPFVFGGSTVGTHVDFMVAGRMTRSGNTTTLSGTMTVYSTLSQVGKSPVFAVILHRQNNAAGAPRNSANLFFSTMLTPTGLPIEQWGGPTPQLAADALTIDPLAQTGENTYSGNFNVTLTLPDNLPDGRYGYWLSRQTVDTSLDGSLNEARTTQSPFISNNNLPFPPFAVGTPSAPRLVFTLLTDVISADGSRGTIASEDRSYFNIANRIVTQAEKFIIPRLSKLDGSALTYRLEPYLPMINNSDRSLPGPPTHAFALPSGSLTASVLRPDGVTVSMGPASFQTALSSTPRSSQGLLLDNGGGHLANTFQLSTLSDAFLYQFPQYGQYTITLSGTIDDIYGTTYSGGGTYTVYVAEPLDIEPGILPMTALEVGDTFNPVVSVLPGVPADVSVSVRLFANSLADQLTIFSAVGKANRFGVFTAADLAAPMTLTSPGELIVTTDASYTDSQGVLWMGSTCWGQVVAPQERTLIAHGRRGVDDQTIDQAQAWYTTSISPASSAHAQLPYFSGDVIWQGNDEAERVQLTVEDTSGEVEAAATAWDAAANYHSQGDHSTPAPTFAERAAKDEIPLGLSTSSGVSPSEEPDDIVSYGYWYGGMQRSGERVREIISTDDNPTGYWRFEELYGLQPGLGFDGDAPNDFKFQFGGIVFRDLTRSLTRYGIYASLWTHLSSSQDHTTIVQPPLQSGNEPLVWVGGQAVNAFVVPLAVKPGTVLVSGDRFSFSAQVAPTLDAAIEVKVSGPKKFSETISGRANDVGYFYDPAQDFVLSKPGIYHVAVQATFDGSTSAGALSPPYPTGTVLGGVKDGFDIYVVPKNSKPITVEGGAASVVEGTAPVKVTFTIPAKVKSGKLFYTIGMPGYLLKSGKARIKNGKVVIVYDPETLANTFPNIDLEGRASTESGLADTVWISAVLQNGTKKFTGQHITLQGPDLYVPKR